MTFKDRLKSDMDNIFLDPTMIAEDVDYTIKGGSLKTVDAIVVEGLREDSQDTTMKNKNIEFTIYFSKTDIPVVTTDDIFVSRGISFKVIDFNDNDLEHNIANGISMTSKERGREGRQF